MPALPPGYALYQMAMGHFVPRALALAARFGLADLLKDGPRSAGDLAAVTQTHAPALARMMRLLASVGVFAEQPDGTFALTPLGAPLRADFPGSVRALVLLFAGSIGRTDLPLSDPDAMERSLALVSTFDPDTVVYPGHGPPTNIGQELATNPFLAGYAGSI
ncbi:MAG: hypothetical protein L0271_10710 [Gemmatimonadetes bacterium]|nr:hypothetical protein [Gemmatimonadota bacterium]